MLRNPFRPFVRRGELRRVFEGIHASNAWGSAESRSGPGSTRARAAEFLPALLELVSRHRIGTLLDAPCGDFNWARPLADAVELYIGVDVVPALIASNRARHASARRRFLRRDIVRDRLPSSDLLLCRDAFVHLEVRDVLAALRNMRRSGARWLLLTTFIGDRENSDIATGDWRPINLQRPPFGLPEPVELVDEKCAHSGGEYEDKRLGLWRAADLS